MEWTRNTFTPIADEDERLAWYQSIGLDGWFDITMSASGQDVMTLYSSTAEGASKMVVEFDYMNVGSNLPRVKSAVKYYQQNSSSYVTSFSTATPQANTTNGDLSFDTATVGNIQILRICTSNLSWLQTINFAKESDGTFFVMASPTSSYERAGAYVIMDSLGRSKHEKNASSSSFLQYDSRNMTYMDKYVVRPVVDLGNITHIYSMDGSSNYAPVGNTEFTLAGKKYFSLGHGFVVKEG